MPDPESVYELIAREPPPRALEWARRAVGRDARILSVSALSGGTSHGNHALQIETASSSLGVVLRRWVRPDWRTTDPEYSAAQESSTYRLLEGTSTPAPVLLAADVDGDECDVPALLLTRVPGRPLDPSQGFSRRVRPLAAAIFALHSSSTSEAARTLLPYRPFSAPAAVMVPAWTSRPESWRRAIELSATPSRDGCTFIHRDFHPGNTVWVEDAVSAIVDWTTASWGPPSVDLSHMRVNLALSTGLDAADAFLTAYRSASGSDLLDPLWDLKMAVDFVPDLRADRMTAGQLGRLDAFILAALASL